MRINVLIISLIIFLDHLNARKTDRKVIEFHYQQNSLTTLIKQSQRVVFNFIHIFYYNVKDNGNLNQLTPPFIQRNSTSLNQLKGLYERVYFLYIYGASVNDIEQATHVESVLSTMNRVSTPFLNTLNLSLYQEPKNSYWARVNVSNDIQEQFQRLNNLMNGAKVQQLQNEKYFANPTYLVSSEKNIDVKKSIIDQLVSFQQVGNYSQNSSQNSQFFNSFNSNGKNFSLSHSLNDENKMKSLNEPEKIMSMRKEFGKVVSDTKNLDEIFELMTSNNQDFVIAYDDTIAKVKLLFDQTSSQVQKTYQKVNQLIKSVIESVNNNTLFIVMGEDISININDNKENQLQNSYIRQGESFFFAYSKSEFASTTLINEIETYVSKKLVISEILSASQKQNKSNKNKTINKNLTQSYLQNNQQQQINYITENSIASTLALAIGLEVPTLNFGRCILQINQLKRDEDGEEEFSILFNNIIQGSYKTLYQQIDLFSSLQDQYNFFQSETQNFICNQIHQIEKQQENLFNYIEQLKAVDHDIRDIKAKLKQEQEFSTLSSVEYIQLKDQLQMRQSKRQQIKEYVSAQLADVIELQEFLQIHLDGKKRMSISVIILFIMFYIACIFFSLKHLLSQMFNIYSSQKERVRTIEKQLKIILPLSVIGYFIFSLYSTNKLSDQVVDTCIKISAGIFFIELVFFRQKLQTVKTFFIISVLYIIFKSLQTSGLATLGLFCHLILRLRFGTDYQNYSNTQNLLFGLLIIILSSIRLLSFNMNSPIIDSILILLVLRNKNIKIYDKICFIILIATQYLYNFSYPKGDEIGSYLIYGCSIFVLVMIVELYETIGQTLSFNKFFITNILFIYFLNILINLSQPTTLFQQFSCCFVFFFPSFIISVITENNKCTYIQTCIYTFTQQESNKQIEKVEIKNQEQQFQIKFKNQNLEIQFQKKYTKNQDQKISKNLPQQSQIEDFKLYCQNRDSKNKEEDTQLDLKLQLQKQNVNKLEEIDSTNLVNNLTLKYKQNDKIQNDKFKLKLTKKYENSKQETTKSDNIKRQVESKEHLSIDISSLLLSQIKEPYLMTCCCSINIKNFGIYTMTGILQLLFTLITLSQIFTDKYTLNPIEITKSKQGLIQYSIFQYLIATICIIISSQIKKKSKQKKTATNSNYKLQLNKQNNNNTDNHSPPQNTKILQQIQIIQ